MKGLIGKKVGMTQVYDEKGALIPVTVVEAGPCRVLGFKTPERDGYAAVQFGFGVRKIKNISKSVKGSFAKAGIPDSAPAVIREFRVSGGDAAYEIGTEVTANIFQPGEFLDVTGVSKGRGFSGVMTRHHFKGGRDGHGGGWHRKPGSIGCCEQPAHVVKGKRLPGQYGNASRTVQNLRVVKVEPEQNLLFVSGAVPGPNGGVVLVKKAKKK